MRVIPGSHLTGRRDHGVVTDPDSMIRGEGLAAIDEDQARDVILRPGQMSLHHGSLIHGSGPNRSLTMRLGYIIRFVTPAYQFPDFRFSMLGIAGEHGEHALLSPPESGSFASRLARWRACHDRHQARRART